MIVVLAFDTGLIAGLALPAAIRRAVIKKEKHVMSKTSLNSATSESIRSVIHGKRTSGRFTSIAHRADSGSRPAPVAAKPESVQQTDDAPVEALGNNDFVRRMISR